jgi:predicted dehydrogenase
MIRTLIAGLGNMGMSHALALHAHPMAEVVGLVNRTGKAPSGELQNYPCFDDFTLALAQTKPDLVVIATYTDTHADFAVAAMQAGAHVFVEKPLAMSAAEAERVVASAKQTGRKLVVGYILRHHPSWQRLIAEARALGGPYVFRLNLNQQSQGAEWETHKALMQTTSPIVDCGVHYVDVMCQITDAKPLRVHAMGLRLSDEIAPDMYNYGQFQVVFSDGSVGWYEAGWGPMISETAYFVKDIISPNGAVSIVANESWNSADIDRHTKVGQLRLHPVAGPDQLIQLEDEPGHQALCNAEQDFVLRAITQDIDLSRHMDDAVQSLKICLAADASIRSGQAVSLEGALL